MIYLERCPCCNELAFVRNPTSYNDIDLFYVQCNNPECKLRTPYGTVEEVSSIWNRRP